MSPRIATVVCAAGILGLFWLDRDQKAKTSGALWIPVIWLLIACSRPVNQWLHMGTPIDTANQVLDGSPLDRAVWTCLLFAGLIVLVGRSRQVGKLLRAQGNGPILFFFFYCAVSLLWSDFPGVGLKRWIKAVGDLVMILIVLSDPEPLAAFKRLLSRLAFVLIPLSILLIKYYPLLGREYNEWTGTEVYAGVTPYKNTLGAICLCLGLGALWSFIAAYRDRENSGRIRRMIAQGVILAMVVWLFLGINSMTSLSCFLMASALLLAANFRAVIRKPAVVHFLVVSMVAVSAAVLFLGADPEALHAIGRNPSLTDRTYLWGQLLSEVRQPLFGTGYGNFWLGPRLKEIWRLNPWHPNEAHDGYLEVFLNLGWMGVALLGVVLAVGYRTVFRAWRGNDSRGNLSLAYFFAGLVFNFTEAAFFQMQAVVWLFFLFAIVSVPAASCQNDWIIGSEADSASSPVAWEQAPSIWSEEVV